MGLSGNVIIICVTALLLIPHLGMKRGGATRWLNLGGFSFQVTEMVKIAIVVFLAHLLTRKAYQLKNFSQRSSCSFSRYLCCNFTDFTGAGFRYGCNYCHYFAFDVVHSGSADKTSFIFDSGFHSCRSIVDFV